MKDLVDDGPSEPLFTPSVMPEAEPVRQQPAPQGYTQPVQAQQPPQRKSACRARAAGEPDSPAADA
jgi:S-DNA-T family DNA segregation ATPase FtsK/SpoIIIE